MKPWVTLLVLLLFAAPRAMAQGGINLQVGDCGVGSTAILATNACTTNSGNAFVAFVSCVVPQVTVPGFVAVAAIVDVQSTSATLPDWWRADMCRSSGFALAGDPLMGGSCPTIWDRVPNGGVALTGAYGVEGLNRIRLLLSGVIHIEQAYDLTGDGATELSLFRLTVLNSKTVGTGACGGCSLGACLVLNQVELQGSSSPWLWPRLTNPLANNFIGYNLGGPGPWCPAATPTRNHTWGAIKSLYR